MRYPRLQQRCCCSVVLLGVLAAYFPPRLQYFVGFLQGCLAFSPQGTSSPIHRATRKRSWSQQHARGSAAGNEDKEPSSQFPAACIEGYVSPEERDDLLMALRVAGYQTALVKGDQVSQTGEELPMYQYMYSKATGMLKLQSSPSMTNDKTGVLPMSCDAPRWIPIVRGEENVLVANGWSFLDPDENEPASAFDIDAANEEGLYRPKWGQQENDEGSVPLSLLGYSLQSMSAEQVMAEAQELQSALHKSVLLEGATDPPKVKRTHNDYHFSGSAGQSDIEPGVFVCAIGGLPLFTTLDLSPTTASSGWLSFSEPISEDHVVLVKPDKDALDQRVEVLCAKSGCHLGHYFGKGEGYCINASALNFIPKKKQSQGDSRRIDGLISLPVSWRSLESRLQHDAVPPTKLLCDIVKSAVTTETLCLGAGCFWHVEFALRRLPGVVSTEVGYAGGTTSSPTYEDVCHKDTAHAEVVKVSFDPNVLNPQILMDCFLALHDPTKVRAAGKHEKGTGQYRSCVFVTNDNMERHANEALQECQAQLQKPLSTEVLKMDPFVDDWFWRAEERHQRHDEKRSSTDKKLDTSTLSTSEWLLEYGRRSESVWGSSQTVKVSAHDEPQDDGMAMMRI